MHHMLCATKHHRLLVAMHADEEDTTVVYWCVRACVRACVCVHVYVALGIEVCGWRQVYQPSHYCYVTSIV